MIIVEFFGFTTKERIAQTKEIFAKQLDIEKDENIFFIETEVLVRDLKGDFKEIIKITYQNDTRIEKIIKEIRKKFKVNILIIDKDAIHQFIPEKE